MALIENCLTHLQTQYGHVFVNPISGACIATDDVGGRTIERMTQIDDEDAIIEEISQTLGINPISAAARYVAFLQKLKEMGMLARRQPIYEETPIPFFGFIEVTRKCSTMCRICAIDTGRGSRDVLSLDEIKNAIDQFKDIGVKMVALTGGDPLVRDDLLQILAYIRKKELMAGFSTSLLTLDEETAKRLVDLDVKVQVSLDGSNSETNDFNRGSGSFEKAIAGIELLRKYGVEFRIAFCIMKHNIDDITDMVELAEKLGAKEVAFRKVKLLGRALKLKDLIYPSPKEMTKAYASLYRAAYQRLSGGIKINAKYNSVFFSGRGSGYDQLPCGAGRNIIHITYKGDIVPCSLFTEDKFIQGNIRKDRIETIWKNSQLLRFFRETTVDQIPKCSSCRYRYLCGGGCRAESYFLEGDLMGNCCDCEDLLAFYDYFLSWVSKSQDKVLI